jgi:hypothetical protein
MARINVFLNDDLLKGVDAESRLTGTRRSALIQAALERHLEAQRRAREEAEAQRRMDDACRKMDALAEKLGDWDPVAIIREFRESRSARSRPAVRNARARVRR